MQHPQYELFLLLIVTMSGIYKYKFNVRHFCSQGSGRRVTKRIPKVTSVFTTCLSLVYKLTLDMACFCSLLYLSPTKNNDVLSENGHLNQTQFI